MTRYAHITGWGMAVPERVLTNDDLAQIVETSDEWIRTRTGIRERRIAGPEDTTASLATQAALRALETARVRPTEVDLVIVATSSPEYNNFPATASLVQNAIGAVKAGAFDLAAACTGFIYGVHMAAQAIRSGAIDTALVIGAETLSRIVDWEDRNTCVLFGDGAGAFVLQACEAPGGVLSGVMRSDGSGAEMLYIPAGGSREPASAETVAQKRHFMRMKGREVFRFATRVMAEATREAATRAGWETEAIDLIIPHQANLRIIEAAAKRLKLPLDRFVVNLDRYGNTSTASVPIAAFEAASEGRLRPGDKVILVGFGGGLTWGAVAVQWSGPLADRQKPVRTKGYVWWSQLRSLLRRLGRRLSAWWPW